MRVARSLVVAGIGNQYRGDDAAGIAIARLVVARCPGAVDIGPVGEPLDLLGRWDGADLAVIADATRSGLAPGTVRVCRIDGGAGLAAPAGATSSTHGVGVGDVLRLSVAVGCAPRRVAVVGIEGRDFALGAPMSPAVEAALGEARAAAERLIHQSVAYRTHRAGAASTGWW